MYLDMTDCLKAEGLVCCHKQCASKFTGQDIYSIRKEYFEIKGQERRQHVFDKVRSAALLEGAVWRFYFKLLSRAVCETAFKTFLTVSTVSLFTALVITLSFFGRPRFVNTSVQLNVANGSCWISVT